MSDGAKWFMGGVIFMVFIAGALIFGYWYGQQKAGNETSEQVVIPTVTKTEEPKEETAAADKYEGWKDYTNKSIGYELKYPSDWVVKEINTYNETIENTVKYITLTSPNGKYFLHFGLKKKADTFAVTDRTGMGAGEIKKTGEKITILETSVDIESFIYQSRIKEYFYPRSTTTASDGKYQFTATFSYTDKVNYDTLDMTGIEEEKTAEQILESVTLL